MGLFSKTKNVAVKEGLRIVGAEELKRGFDSISDMVTTAVRYNLKKHVPSKATFSMDTSRYIQIQKEFRKILFFFIILFIFAIIYTVIGVIDHNWKLVFTSLAFSIMCLAFAFRYHFWLYQMKRKRLGCTFQEWFEDEIKGRFGRKQVKEASSKPVKQKDRK